MFATTNCDQMMFHYHPQRPMENRWKPSMEIAPNCPRCASPNTKFCYYNNYSLSQPRYFCKGCRRYWTKGGSLRNVPIGGGCRRNRRARPPRSSQLGRLSSSYAHNRLSPDSDSVSESPERADIDMADVFAKFLNQNPDQQIQEFVNEDSYSGTQSGSLELPLCYSENTVSVDYNSPFDLMEETLSQNVLPLDEEDEIDEFMVQQSNLLELQEILNDELPQDIAWSDDVAILPNSTLQQDFEPFSCNNEQKIATDIVIDEWNSPELDLPGFEIIF